MPRGNQHHTIETGHPPAANASRYLIKLSESYWTRGDKLLAQYFQDLAQGEKLDAEQERVLAAEIGNMEQQRWQTALSDPSILEAVVSTIVVTVQKEYKQEIVQTAKEAIDQLQTQLQHLSNCTTDAEEYHIAIEAISAALASIDSRRVLFSAVYHTLTTAPTAVHTDPDLIWSLDKYEVVLEQLRRRFANANLRLVVLIAKRYDYGQLPLSDLIQEGNIGLMKAVKGFDHTRGFRFSTYAGTWIRHGIQRALDNTGSTVRMPSHLKESHYKLAHAVERFYLQHGRPPSDTELSKATGMTQPQIVKIRNRPGISTLSLDTPMPNSNNMKYMDSFADGTDPGPHETTLVNIWNREMDKLLTVLSKIEREIICRRFGLHGKEEKTLRQLGKQLNLSRERVRQIQNIALEKLRVAIDTV